MIFFSHSLAARLSAGIFLLASMLSLIGCSNENDLSPHPSFKGVKFFASQVSTPLNTPKLVQIAKAENMVLIEPGQFLMGSPTDEVGRKTDETLNTVKITYPFWIKKFEVTQADWNEVVLEEQKRGDPVFLLPGKIINEICTPARYLDGHYSIAGYHGSNRIEIFVEEVILSNGSWIRPKNPKNYKILAEKFGNIDELLEFLSNRNIKQIDYTDQNLPVSRISYSQAVAYCWKKTQNARLSQKLPEPFVYRLPTEAEWEYACRANTVGICGTGEGNFLTGENANIDGSMRGYVIDQRPKSEFSDMRSFTPIYRKGLVSINTKNPAYPANAWGLYDMHGNVMEWCYDFYGPYPDDNLTREHPIGPIRGNYRVVRGGSFVRTAHESRSASRFSYEASYRGSEIGFRYVLGLPLR